MNFVEAMKAMLEGKKVRIKSWSQEHYMQIINNKIVNETGWDFRSINFNNEYIYELYQEPQEQLFQWVYRGSLNTPWRNDGYLRTEKEAVECFKGCEYKKLNDVLGSK